MSLQQIDIAGGGRIAFRFDGPTDAPLLMLAHAILCDHHMWGPLVERLQVRYRVLRYDARGHGQSPATESPYTIAALADDAIGLLDALAIARVHFIGLSLGGMVGQYLGAVHGERLHSLTLANTIAKQQAASAWDERIALSLAQGTGALAEATLMRWFTPLFCSAQPARLQAIREQILHTSVAGFAGCAAAVRGLDQIDLLCRIRTPTLVLSGADDGAAPPQQMRLLHAGIRGADWRSLPEAAHLSAVEQPGAFGDALTAFIDKLPAGS